MVRRNSSVTSKKPNILIIYPDPCALMRWGSTVTPSSKLLASTGLRKRGLDLEEPSLFSAVYPLSSVAVHRQIHPRHGRVCEPSPHPLRSRTV